MSDQTKGVGQAKAGPDATAGGQEGEHPREGGQDEVYLGTWKTKEDAEKGVGELTRMLNESRSRENKAKSEAEKVRNEQLSKLTEAVSAMSAPKGKTQADVEAERAQTLQRWEDQGNAAILEDISASLAQVEKRASEGVKGELRAEIASLKEALTGFQSQVQNRLGDLDPAYLAKKDLVDSLISDAKERGQELSRQQAMYMADVIDSKTAKTDSPDRPPLPGQLGGAGRVVDAAGELTLPDEEVAMIEQATGVKMTEATKRHLAKKHAKKGA